MTIQYLMSGARASDGAKIVLWRVGNYEYNIDVGGATPYKHHFNGEYYQAVARYKSMLEDGIDAQKDTPEITMDANETYSITLNRQQLDRLNEFAKHFGDIDKFTLATKEDGTITISFSLFDEPAPTKE